MILFRAYLEGTTFAIQTLPGQSFEKRLPISVNDIKITAPIADIVKFPLGTVFCADESGYDFPEDDHLHIRKENITALYYDNDVFPLNCLESIPLVDYLIDYMIDHSEFGVDKAKEMTEKYEPYGYSFDWDAKFAIPAAGEALPAGANLRRTIAANYPVPSKEDCGFHIDPDLWFLLVRNVLRRENTLLIGPTGSGKTEILNHLAKAMSKELFIQDMGTVQDAQSALLGVHRIGKTGHSEFEFAPFVEHIKSGGIVLLDELNR